MSELNLDEIGARAAAATDGPWEARGEFVVSGDLDGVPDCVAAMGDDGPQELADAEFIAHARKDVPALLSDGEAARAEATRERARADRYRDRHDEVAKELAAERVKLIRLAAAKCWTNEDGKRFIFLSDIQAALGLPVEDTTSEPEVQR